VVVGAFRRLKSSSLSRRDTPVTNARETIGWWEARRIPFNLMVASAGVLSGIVIGVVAAGSYFLFNSDFGAPGQPFFELVAVLIYALLANVFFTGGWIAELIVRKIWPKEADRFATLSFSLGLVFSVLLTLAPGIAVGVVGIFGLVGHLLGVIHSS
jgi:hypothetical protein